MVTRWSRLSLKTHTKGMRSTEEQVWVQRDLCAMGAWVQHPQWDGNAVIQTGRSLRQTWELSRKLSEVEGDKDRLV